LKLYANELGSIRKLIDNGDGAGLEKLFAAAREARDKWIHSS
jgi:prephenate dehydrogenase